MNLELLDPFGRQIPDRVDATLPLAPHLHFRNSKNPHLQATLSPSTSGGSGGGRKTKKSSDGEEPFNHPRHSSNTTNVNSYALNVTGSGLSETGGTITTTGVITKREVPEWRAAYNVSFNRRGTYCAVGYGSGAVAVHSTSSRTLAALYRSPSGGSSIAEATSSGVASGGAGSSEMVGGNGVTSVSWSRRSRTLLTGATGDSFVHVYDTTHPFGPEEAGLAIDDPGGDGSNEAGTGERASKTPSQKNKDDAKQWQHAIRPAHLKRETRKTLFADPDFDELRYVVVKQSLPLEAVNIPMGTKIPQHVIESFAVPEFPVNEMRDDTLLADDDSDEAADTSNKKDNKKRKKKKKKKPKRNPGNDRRLKKHPCVSFSFHGDKSVGGSLQINPRYPTGGLAALMDGSLVLFWFDPASSWITQKTEPPKTTKDQGENKNEGAKDDKGKPKDDGDKGSSDKSLPKKNKDNDDAKLPTKYALVVPLWSQSQTSKHFITCAAFDPQGERVYAATKDGTLMGFEVKALFDSLAASSPSYSGPLPEVPAAGTNNNTKVSASPIKGGLPLVAPHFKLSIPGGASAWHLIVSRNGKYLVLNSSDGVLRLYSTDKCWAHTGGKSSSSSSKHSAPSVEKPTWTFQDVVSKVKFVSCDLSGDGEFVVGGANVNDNRYELSIWNTSTGNLMDKLIGPAVQLYSLAWHPTRASLAVATSDGLVDVWSPKMNWTAFAPDFQALHKNIVYEEEDEGDADDEKEEETPQRRSSLNVGGDKRQNSNLPTTTKSMDEDAEMEDADAPLKKRKTSLGRDKKKAAEGTIVTMKENIVDVLSMEPVPMFASDSEDETETFAFETRVKNLFVLRQGKGAKGDKNDD